MMRDDSTMTPNWLRCRLPEPLQSEHDHKTQILSDVLPGLVRYFRSADPGGRWFFQRFHNHLELWFCSAAAVRHELERRLAAEFSRHGWPMIMDCYESPSAHYIGTRDAELSSASSELALDLLNAGELRGDAQLTMAVQHLCHIVELIPGGDRTAFLFFYWTYWANGMSPGQRIDLATRADRDYELILRAAAKTQLLSNTEVSWQRYLWVVRETILTRRPNDDIPANYLLFKHAHLTNNRLGIGVATEALAARALRTTLREGMAGAALLVQPRIRAYPRCAQTA